MRTTSDGDPVCTGKILNLINEYFIHLNLFKRKFFFIFKDLREDICHDNVYCTNGYSNGLRRTTRADCCCTRGVAWGQYCERCPAVGTSKY